MYCPNCGQQQISDEMRFCSRCGLALSGLAEWLAGGALPARRQDEVKGDALSPRRKGIRRAAKLMFFSGVMFPLFLIFSIAVEEPGPLLLPISIFFIALMWMLYARLFSEPTASVALNQPAQTPAMGPNPVRGSLPPPVTVPVPGIPRQHVRTNELAQPPSVTENTTKLLDSE